MGHDWGAAVTWYCAQLHPERYRGMVTMSVPYGGPGSETPPLQRLRKSFGENFFYMLYFQDDAAELELNSRTRELFEKFFGSFGAAREKPIITDSHAKAGGLLDRIGAPKQPPLWISANEIDYFVTVFRQTGFRGGLNYYRNLDRTWINRGG